MNCFFSTRRTAVAAALLLCGSAAAFAQQTSPPPSGSPSPSPAPLEPAKQKQRDDATAAVHLAVNAMAPAVWHVDVKVRTRATPNPQGSTDWRVTGVAMGLVSGADFDFTSQGDPVGNTRVIGVQGKLWVSDDGGLTWNTTGWNRNAPNYPTVAAPSGTYAAGLQFGPAGREQHADGTWLHVSALNPPAPLDYWLLLDGNGKAVRVEKIAAQFQGPQAGQGQQRIFLYTMNFSPAKQGEAVSKPADSNAQSDAKALAGSKAQLEQEVAAAAKALAATKSATQSADAALAQAKAQAAAHPGDASLAQTEERAAAGAQAAEQAGANAKKEMDAKIAQMLDVNPRANEAAEKAADAQAAATAAKAAAAKALADAQAEDQAEHFDAWARASLEHSVRQSKKGHLATVALVIRDGMAPLSFRYDTFPGIERVVAEDGAVFARVAGKGWIESADWGKTGVPARGNRPADLDAMAELTLRPFQPVAPDPQEGAVVWRHSVGNAFPIGQSADQSREHPHSAAAGVYPNFEFSMDMTGGNGPDQEQAPQLLWSVTAPWNWRDGPAQVIIDYYYAPGVTQPAGDPAPEEQLAAVLRSTQSTPVKVDATLLSNARVRVAGIVSGKDFDLTISRDGKTWRQIAIGDAAWSSADGGATWKKETNIDRTYFDLANEPVGGHPPGWPLQWPFVVWSAAPGANGGIRQQSDFSVMPIQMGGQEGDPALQRYGLILPYAFVPPDGLNYLVSTQGGKPVLRSAYDDKVSLGKADPLSGKLYVDYTPLQGKDGVLPPPGNPGAVPAGSANDLLDQAANAMAAAPVRNVDCKLTRQEMTNSGTWEDKQVIQRIHGLVAGRDFDITAENTPEGPAGPQHIIMVKNAAWTKGKSDNAWKPETPDGTFAVRQHFAQVYGALDPAVLARMFTIVGKEDHDSKTWLHIRAVFAMDSYSDYWLQLDGNGKPVFIRRCAWAEDSGSGPAGQAPASRNYFQEDFTAAKPGEEIKVPAGSSAATPPPASP